MEFRAPFLKGYCSPSYRMLIVTPGGHYGTPPHLSACLSVPLPPPLILSDHQINLLIGVCPNVKHSSTLFCFDHFFLLEQKRRKSYEEVRQISWKGASMTIEHT